jgi:hypothetical protein
MQKNFPIFLFCRKKQMFGGFDVVGEKNFAAPVAFVNKSFEDWTGIGEIAHDYLY